MRRVARELALFAAFLAIAIVFTWPLAIRLETSVADPGDPLLNAWILDWTSHALTHDPLHLFDAPIYHGGLFPLAYSEHLSGIALLVLPFHLAGLAPLTVYNIAMLLGFAFSAYAAFVLARLVSGSSIGAFAGAMFFAFGSFAVMHISHLQVVWSGWLPMLLAALLWWWREPSWKRAALLGAAFAMNGLTNIYWLLYGGFALVVTMVLLHWSAPRRWTQLIVALAVASAILLPFLIPYQMVASEYGARRTTAEASLGSASLLDWAMPSPNNRLYGNLPPEGLQRAERQLFPGVAVLALMAIAFFRVPRVPRVPRGSSGSSGSRIRGPRNPEEPRGTRGTAVNPSTSPSPCWSSSPSPARWPGAWRWGRSAFRATTCRPCWRWRCWPSACTAPIRTRSRNRAFIARS